MSDSPADLWTIGHSTRPWDVFLTTLDAARIEVLVDVRRFAGSRRNPQYGGDTMGDDLGAASVHYVPMPALGGRRTASVDSPNVAWRNASFRGYADYMQTRDYQQASQRLQAIAQRRRTAIMCAEAMWWQCHRSLISDEFKAAGWRVIHLQAPGREQEHPYSSAARIIDGRLDYRGDAAPASPQASLF